MEHIDSFINGFLVVVLVLLLLFVLPRLFQRRTVFEHEHALRFVRGRFSGVLPAGAHWLFAPTTTVRILDARPRITTVPGQELLSSDGVSIKVSLLLVIRVPDPRIATTAAENYEQMLYARAQEALRAAVGLRSIEDLLRVRGELSAELLATLAPAASALGLELRAASVKDIMFPGTLKEAFSATARARQEAHAGLERARGESAALRHLANAARLFESHPSLFQLRLLQSASVAGRLVLHVGAPGTAGERSLPAAEDAETAD